MAKAIEDRGSHIEATKPLKLKRYPAGKEPNAGQCVDSLIIVNDQLDGVPRARLAISNGATWDHIAWLHELKAQPSQALVPVERDLTPMIRAAVETALPALVSAPAVKVIQGPQSAPEGIKELAAAMLDISGHVNLLANENADLRAEIEVLKSQVRAIEQVEVVTGIKAA